MLRAALRSADCLPEQAKRATSFHPPAHGGCRPRGPADKRVLRAGSFRRAATATGDGSPITGLYSGRAGTLASTAGGLCGRSKRTQRCRLCAHCRWGRCSATPMHAAISNRSESEFENAHRRRVLSALLSQSKPSNKPSPCRKAKWRIQASESSSQLGLASHAVSATQRRSSSKVRHNLRQTMPKAPKQLKLLQVALSFP